MPSVILAAVVVAVGASAAGCADGAFHEFEEMALPVIEARCLSVACHGVGPGQQTPAGDGFFIEVDARGAARDLQDAHTAALARVTTLAPTLSSLLREPMPRWAGGTTHAGGDLFQGPEDRAAGKLRAWIESEASGGEDVELSPLQAQFAETVMPVLVERCARAGCHGPDDGAFTSFAATPEAETGAFAPLDAVATYKAARKHLDLWSDTAERSRLIRKAIGQFEGGMVHRGGNNSFFPEARPGHPQEAPGLEAMLEWADAERSAVGSEAGRVPTALVYVGGPVAPRLPFRIEASLPGSDVYWSPWPVDPAEQLNLTADLHPEGPAELRDPALSHAGNALVFAMRRQGETHFSLWEMDLRSHEAQRVPFALSGSLVQPTYAPDGRIVAVWDGHGGAGADGDGIAPELVAIDARGEVERLTYTPAPEVSPSFLATGKTAGQLLFSTRRGDGGGGEDGAQGVMFRFPLCHNPDFHGDPEYHVHFGASIAPRTPLAARDLADGRQVMVLLERPDAQDDRGQLALLDRSMGPALAPDELSSLGGQRQPMTVLDASPRFRDPAPLPDGRIVVAADDESSPGLDSLWLVSIRDDGDGASLDALEPLLAVAGQSIRSPVPVFSRPREDGTHDQISDPELDDGFVILRDVAILETLYGHAQPTGARNLRQDIAAVRVIAWGGALDRDLARYGDGGTTVGASAWAPTHFVDELTLPSDRSAWLRLPARLPVRLQWLDARGMLIGNQLDRWYFADGAETVPGGTNAATYAHACTACHGALSGDPDDASAAAPDAITSASVTLSTHRDRNPRLPLEPRDMGSEPTPIDYVHSVAPIFEDRCVSGECHGGATPAAGLALDDGTESGRFSTAYQSLLDGPVDREGLRARTSALVERLLGEELDAPGRVTGQCPPGGLPSEELATVIRWIEGGAFYDLDRKEDRGD